MNMRGTVNCDVKLCMCSVWHTSSSLTIIVALRVAISDSDRIAEIPFILLIINDSQYSVELQVTNLLILGKDVTICRVVD